jgi:hypothetical protein
MGLVSSRLELELQYDAPPSTVQQHPARVFFRTEHRPRSHRLRLIQLCSFFLHLYTACLGRSRLHHSSKRSSHIWHPARQSLRHVRPACEQPLQGRAAPRTRRAHAYGAEHACETRRPVRQHASSQPAKTDADPFAAALRRQGECIYQRAEGQEEEHPRGG